MATVCQLSPPLLLQTNFFALMKCHWNGTADFSTKKKTNTTAKVCHKWRHKVNRFLKEQPKNLLTKFDNLCAFECIKDESTQKVDSKLFFDNLQYLIKPTFFELFFIFRKVFVACHEIALTRQGETTHAYQDLKHGSGKITSKIVCFDFE